MPNKSIVGMFDLIVIKRYYIINSPGELLCPGH